MPLHKGPQHSSYATVILVLLYTPFHMLSVITTYEYYFVYTRRNSNTIALVCRVEFVPSKPTIHRGFSGRWCCYRSCRDTGDNIDQTASR